MKLEPKILIKVEGGVVTEWETNVENLEVEIFDVNDIKDDRGLTDEQVKALWLRKVDELNTEEYSVLLEYPNGDTYYAWVWAPDEYEAVVEAKKDAILSNPEMSPDDFAVLLVLKGHIDAELRKEDL